MLDAYRVLDLTDGGALLCGQILADLGADVIQVEPPGGAAARRLGPFAGGVEDPVGSSRVDLQACKLEYSIVSPK